VLERRGNKNEKNAFSFRRSYQGFNAVALGHIVEREPLAGGVVRRGRKMGTSLGGISHPTARK